jgi:uncharacterized protein YdaU (DUF1376 family)
MRAFLSPPLVTDASVADSRHLNGQADVACLHLRIVGRHRARGGLPDDDARLARWARVDLRTWHRIKPTLMASWMRADGRWTPKRPSKERKIVDSTAEIVRQDRSRAEAKPADLRTLARQHGAAAIAALAAILNDPTAPLGARLAAAQALLDRGFGKPAGQADDKASADVLEIRRIMVAPGEQDRGTSLTPSP